jgi:hypothetical protein
MTNLKKWMWAAVPLVLAAVLAVANPSFLTASDSGTPSPKPTVTTPKPKVKKPQPTATQPDKKPAKKKPTAGAPIPPEEPDEGC